MSITKDTEALVATHNLTKEFDTVRKLAKKYKGDVFIFKDWEDGFPENKFYTLEIMLPLPDGLVYMSSNSAMDELIEDARRYFDE